MAQTLRRPFMAEIQMAQRTRPLQAGEAEAPAAAPPPALVQLPADNSEILAAIQGLGNKLDKFLTVDHQQIEQIQVEVSDIAGRIRATKLEMAALRHPLATEDTFQEASQQLAAVVKAAEAATNTIIGAAEEIEDIIGEVRAQLPEGYQNSRLHDLSEVIPRIYEACNFQDLTGQRITKVVNALAFIEERVEAMMSVWNKKEFETLPLPPGLARTDSGLELHGPAMPAETISQDDIDALFD
ncbi:protein phosphatase CheZ [Oleisolibacter albus]|uniref:protein phosphatase CheZ n=1 Tax=Oleisolibacter albus TaxID=2171757 RepID=UPI000DF46EC1|nr:protein phosphatase CheZ [Oleisolibacter albus]